MAKWMSVAQIKEKIEESSAEEVTAHYLEVIKKNKINGYITVSEKALEQAKKIDAEGHNGPLAGVPIAIKDNISVAGLPNSCGSKTLENYIPPFNAHVIEKLLAAGAVILGKTNMDEFAMGSSTETSYFGPTANPWDLERVPGGSSGGSAAVIAAGQAPFALGSDTGGSIRCPAAFCGVVGLKPTYGAVSRHGVVAYANSLEQVGPLANNVRDIAALMDVIAGYDHKDSTSIDSKTEYQKALVEDVKGLKIGVPKEFFGEGIHPDVEKAVWNAIHKYESLGAAWEKISMPNIKYALASYYIIAVSEASSNLARFDGTSYGFRASGDNWHTMVSKTRAEGFGAEVKRRILLGTYALSAGYHDKYYLKALKVRTLVKQDFDRSLSKVDVLMAPTMPNPAFKIGEAIEDPLTLYLSDVNTCPINLAGLPSISVPCGFTDGLPIGLQIMGKPFDEPTVLRAAYTFEQSTDYHTKRPRGVA
ncbi:MAG: Asp-tRNA(Asn)/Glu-tRNA(Gln) amidotransferase subunit GatA [Methanosarcina sp.]|jgi:aspartyl-tRNA(Asn)/glutamyl-tRNA(Gln) amidotransferase subunit A|nr:Asp-tRNA(Asn)/Glu-tRNA(Gln) amidotransferase subunit GatA [Methanosarcina sp.]MDD4304969.1 Asp-tRNA(Asn)/Glu-tRNA(Gln) amidotransferase subunit GatA [Methanosarcina sp.]